jgi:hypothetical protein
MARLQRERDRVDVYTVAIFLKWMKPGLLESVSG